MARIELYLLGPPRLERAGVPLQFDTRKILALVAYVALAGRGAEGGRLRRERLLALLWPDLEPSRARAVLRRNLSLLRRALERDWLVTDRQTVGTDPEADFWLDVDHFSRLVRAWEAHGHPQEHVCPRCLECLAEAVALYRGDFLEGFGLRDSVEYDDWQFFQAEALRRELATALERLVHGHSAQGDYHAALPYARQWLALDPLHEPAQRQLMLLYAETGQRSAALRQYQECIRILEEELGLAPEAETTALYERVRSAPPEGTGLPARAVPSHHNLPAQTTPFVGREEELAELGARLQEPACRLLTLLGPGGIGKTRLALRLAEDLVEARAFEHGVFFVSLAPLQSVEGVVAAVAEALGYAFYADTDRTGRATPRQQLFDSLVPRQVLLVMDNYEHLLVDRARRADGSGSDDGGGAAGFVSDLLSTAPGVKVLATSRASLKVQGEHLYPLAGLRVPEASAPALASAGQALPSYSAIELFEHGVQRVRAGFELQSQDWVHAARICRLVQGMPLAILLAAGWAEMLTFEEITDEIQRSLDFLQTDLRDVPLRQRSIRAVFDHSWRLLDEREQEVFRGLSVFRGGFTREAALEVVGATLRDLSSLVNKSLLLVSAGRHELHELLRQYAAEQLDRVPEQGQAVRDRHCAYYTTALEQWAEEFKGPRQREAMDEMDLEIENGRAAWYWAVARGQVSCLARSADGIWMYHDWSLRHEEGEAAFRAAVGALEGIGFPEAQRLRAKCLILWGDFHLNLVREAPAVEASERGLALLQKLEATGQDVRHEMALAAFHQARIKRYYHPDPLEAKRLYARSVALYEEVGDRWGLARALAYLGWMAEQLGHFREAQELCERSLAIRRELGDQRGMADAMLHLGIVSWVQGQLEEADHYFRESMGIFRALDDWVHMAHAIKSMGEVLVRRGLFEDGLVLMQSSSDIYRELGYAHYEWGLLPFLAEAQVHLGQYSEALARAQQGMRGSDKSKHRWGVGFSHFVGGLAALAARSAEEAIDSLREAVEVFEEVRQQENRGWALGPLGLAARGAGDMALAQQCVVEALRAGVDLGAFLPVLYGLPAVAVLLADRGAVERAVEVYACASRYGFVAQSRWFKDVAGQVIAAAGDTLPAGLREAAQARGRALAWDAMADALLDGPHPL